MIFWYFFSINASDDPDTTAHPNRLNLSPNCRLLVLMDSFKCKLTALYTVNPQSSNLANSEDTDEMTHNVAFHQCLHCLLGQKSIFKER